MRDLCLWIVCTLFFRGILSSQEFDVRPHTVEVNPGDISLIVCKVRNRRGECAWLKDGNVVGKIPNKYSFQREPSDGDCSISIANSQLEDDDAMWQCQVTQASLDDPTLTSTAIRLTVREAPLGPRIEDNTIQINSGDALTTRANEPRRLHCVSRKGNPPAVLKWFIDKQEITSMSNQSNTTDVEKSKTWQAVSVLDYVFLKSHNQRRLRCVAVHAAYVTGSSESEVKLEVLYPPEILLEGRPTKEIEEGTHVSLRCVSDANPKANIIWRKSGHSGIYDIKDQVDFKPVRRSDSGTYSCAAKNDIGQSEEVHIELDVKFKPKIVRIEPKDTMTVTVNHPTKLICEAEGNPDPKYLWLQKKKDEMGAWEERGRNASLTIHNVSYTFQGVYMCEASNQINGKIHKVQSEEMELDVTGGPQILTERPKTQRNVIVEKDDDAVLMIIFCADPRPKKTFWEWGSYKLDAGSDLIRHVAEPIIPDGETNDCYQARLIIQKVEGSDSRKYTFNIENEKGKIAYPVALEVKEPVSLSVVLAIVVGCVLGLFVFILFLVYLIRSQKLCFNRGSGFTPDSESELDPRNALPKEVLKNGQQHMQGYQTKDNFFAPNRPPVPWYPIDARRYSSTSESEMERDHHRRSLVYGDDNTPVKHLRNEGYTKHRNGTTRYPARYSDNQFRSRANDQVNI